MDSPTLDLPHVILPNKILSKRSKWILNLNCLCINPSRYSGIQNIMTITKKADIWAWGNGKGMYIVFLAWLQKVIPSNKK